MLHILEWREYELPKNRGSKERPHDDAHAVFLSWLRGTCSSSLTQLGGEMGTSNDEKLLLIRSKELRTDPAVAEAHAAPDLPDLSSLPDSEPCPAPRQRPDLRGLSPVAA
jgi:hypothetical protein